MDKFNRRLNYVLFFLCGLLAGMILFGMVANGRAEESPRLLSGALRESAAPKDEIRIQWVRVDLDRVGRQADGPTEAEIWIPWPPDATRDIILCDGWHAVRPWWMVTEQDTIKMQFREDDLIALDGTVGLYLIFVVGE